MTTNKRKRDLLTTLHHIERFHQRRAVLTIHAVASLAIQVMVWGNWYASYAARGIGFENNFFADRIILTIVLGLLWVGHFLVVRLRESNDRAVVQAILAYDMEDEIIQQAQDRLIESSADDDPDADDEYQHEELRQLR